MKGTRIMNQVSRSFRRVGFKFKKHSPEIFLAAGITGTVVSAVMACKATTKVSQILEETKKSIDSVHECLDNEDMKEKYIENDGKKDLAIIYKDTGLELAKLYGPSLVLGVLSISSILTGHNIIRKRNAALSAVYASINKGYKEYRERVVERFGEEVDHQLKYNIKAKEITETVVGEDGKEKTVTKTIQVAESDKYSDYSRFFEQSNSNWEKDPEYNLMFLNAQQRYANDLLQARGHLYLNEVYDMLGIPRSKAGQVVGWIYDEKNPVGDNYVDFGIYDCHKPKNMDFVNGYEPVILLDFNVDGNILEMM